VEVNLTRQVVYLARKGVVLRILDASTGKAATPTPTGNFAIVRRIDGWRQSSLGLLWRPNYFWRGYAVHGSTSVPVYPASHGCVRATVPAMNRLDRCYASACPCRSTAELGKHPAQAPRDFPRSRQRRGLHRMSEHACRWTLPPGLDQHHRVTPDHDVRPSDK
jgi:hypothetical protein